MGMCALDPNAAQHPSTIVEMTSQILLKSLKIHPWSPKSIEKVVCKHKKSLHGPFWRAGHDQGAPRAAPGPPPAEKVIATGDLLGPKRGPKLTLCV